MRNVVVVWLACVLVLGAILCLVPTSVSAGTPGEGDFGILDTEWRKQFGDSWKRDISTSAGLFRGETSCNLDVVTGSEELNPLDLNGLWHSIEADGTYRWLKETGSSEASSSVAIADINEDGIDEVVGGTTSGKTVEVMKATTGDFVWTFPAPPISSDFMYEWHSSPAVGELNPSLAGLEVVILHAYTSTVYQFQGSIDGWNHGLNFLDHVSDPDDPLHWWDGVPVGTEGPDWDIIWVADLTTVGGDLPLTEGDMEYSSPALADVDADGDMDVLIASRTGYVYVIDGVTGAIMSAFPIDPTSASVAVANVNDDPQLEVFVGSVESKFYALRWDTIRTPPGLGLMWVYPLPTSVVYSSAAIGDVDADGVLEVVFGSSPYIVEPPPPSSGAVWSLDAASGSLDWTTRTGGGVYSSPALADRSDVTRWEMTWPFFRANVNRTGYIPGSGRELDVYIGANNSYMYLLRGTDGSLIDRFFVDYTHSIHSSPVLGDIDGDYRIEAHVLTLQGSPSLDPAFWSIEDTGSSGTVTTSCGEPVADFGWWPLKPMEGQEIRFTDLSYDTMGEIADWRWDFHHPGYSGGGPSIFHIQNPTHIYGDNGFFEVTLTVWDDDDNSASVTKTVEVVNANPNIDYWLSALAGSEQRTHGYWKHQCTIDEQNPPNPEHPGIKPEFVEFIRSHSLVWANTNKQEICADLNFAGNEQPQKLRKQLIAVWLNVASGKLFFDTPLIHPRTPSHTIGEFLLEAEDAILRELTGQFGRLHQIAVDINEDAGRFWYVPPVSGLYTAVVTDPGSDDLEFDWDCLSGTTTITNIHYNNGLGPDPYPSPDGIYPFTAEDSVICAYPFPPDTFRPSLTVTDDDGGQAKDEDIVDAWSADYRFVYAMEWVDIGFGFIVVDITVTYLEWDSCVIPIDPITGEPLFGEGFGGEGRQGGDGLPGGGGFGEENGP